MQLIDRVAARGVVRLAVARAHERFHLMRKGREAEQIAALLGCSAHDQPRGDGSLQHGFIAIRCETGRADRREASMTT